MAKNFKRKLLPALATAFAVVILLACSLKDASAISTVDVKEDNTLPDYLERLLAQHSEEVSPSELDKIRTKWAEQIRRNQEVIKATEGAVLEFSPLDSVTTSYLASVEFTSPHEPYGYIEDAEAMTGFVDYNYAHLHTDGWNQNPINPMGGEAFAAGYMSEYAGGDVYVKAKTGLHSGTDPPWKDIVVVYASNDINTAFLQWDLIGYATVPFSIPAWIYVGTAAQYYSCFAIMCWTPPPYPDPYTYPDYFNCIQIDAVYTSESADCRLSISSGAGGTTNPSPSYYWNDLGTPVEVTAVEYTNYDFDHWTIDGDYCTQNPITVTMTQSQHSLQAHFTYVGPTHQLTVLAVNQYGQPGYVPLYIDSHYVGTTGYTYTVTEGNHQIYVESPLFGGGYHVFACYYYDGIYNYSNPMTLSVTEDKTVTACYYTY